MKAHKNILVAFTQHQDGFPYDPDYVFSNQEFNSITAEDVCRWLCLRAFGTPEPLDADVPTHCHASTLHFDKKAISSFIPNRHLGYNVDTRTGNPA
jgi:hypothetical protein